MAHAGDLSVPQIDASTKMVKTAYRSVPQVDDVDESVTKLSAQVQDLSALQVAAAAEVVTKHSLGVTAPKIDAVAEGVPKHMAQAGDLSAQQVDAVVAKVLQRSPVSLSPE